MASAGENKIVMIPKRQESSLGTATAKALAEAERPVEVFGAMADERMGESNGRKAGPETVESQASGVLCYIGVEEVSFSRYQTREITDDQDLVGLARSIQSTGVLQPIIVRPVTEGYDNGRSYEVVAGERRLRASRLAGLDRIPAIIQHIDDKEAVQVGIIENAQRENLNPVEEALAIRLLIDDFHMNQTEIARVIGKNRATVSNALRLLQLDPRVVEMLKDGSLSAGHGRALLVLETGDLQYRFAQGALRNELSVRALEARIAGFTEGKTEDEELSEEEAKQLATLQRQQSKVSDFLGLEEVSLRYDSQGRKRLNLVFDTEASWRRFMAKIRE